MEITTVKILGSNYYVNNAFYVPNDPENRDYKTVQRWLTAGGVPEPEFSLEEVKAKKALEIKAKRDELNTTPITDALGAILDNTENPTGETTYFVFYTSRHPVNPASDPTTILTTVVVLNRAIPYVTEDLVGNRVIINLTPTLAQTIVLHLADRNNNNYKLANAILIAISNATTIEEVEAITWSNSYLG